MKAKTTNMTQGPPWRLLTMFAVPVILGAAFQLLYTVADSAVVGRLIGVDAFAAVGAAGNFYWIVLSVVLGFTQGFGVIFAQRFGAGDFARLKRSFKAALVLCAAIGVALTLIGVFGTRPVLRLVKLPEEIMDDASLYLTVLFAAMWATTFYNLLGAFLRGLGDSKTPMIALITSSAINVALDIAAVSLFHAGVAGVALATVIAQIIASCVCLVKTARIWKNLPKTENVGQYSAFRELLRLGGPMAFRNGVISVGGLALQYVTNTFGTAFIAGIAGAWKLYGLLEIAAQGFEAAAGAFVGQNFGAQKMDRVKDGVKTARRIMLAASVVIAAIIIIFGRYILSALISGEEAQAALDAGKGQLNFMAASLPFLYMLLLRRASLQGMGNAFYPTIAGFAELAARVLGALFLPSLLGETGLYLAQIVGWPVAWLVLFVGHKKVTNGIYKNHRDLAKI